MRFLLCLLYLAILLNVDSYSQVLSAIHWGEQCRKDFGSGHISNAGGPGAELLDSEEIYKNFKHYIQYNQ